MIIDIINEFREKNGKEHILCWNPVENDYCFAHCLHMAQIGILKNLIHAPDCFLNGKAEAVASCRYVDNHYTTIRLLIFNILNDSYEHKSILLNYDNLAYGFYISDYIAFLTIRGW